MVSATAATSDMAAKSDTTDCTDGRSCLLEAVQGLSAEHFDVPNVIGAWSVRDCLAHLVGWDAWASNAFELAAAGISLSTFPSEREINESAPSCWTERPIEELIDTLRDVRHSIVKCVSLQTEEERESPSIEIDGHVMTVNELLDGLIEHELEHASQIRTWRKTQGL